MLNQNEAGLPRRIRRALAAKRRTVIRKKEAFGRIAVTAFVEDTDTYHRDRIEYIHMGKGRMSRVLTDHLLFSLQV
jgi:hypothetical protein